MPDDVRPAPETAGSIRAGFEKLMAGDVGGAAEIEALAETGDPTALCAAATLAAAGVGRAQDFRLAIARLAEAARRGSRVGQDQLALLAGPEGQVDVDAWTAPQPRTPVRETPRIRVVEQFLPPAVCAWIMAAAERRLAPVTMFNPATRRDEPHPGRNGRVAFVDLASADVVTALVRARIAATVKIPLPCFEPTQILHYADGQTFAPHFDFLERPNMVDFRSGEPYLGQRIATFLVYLNDGYEDGETEFPRADFRFRGKAGDALYFANVDAAGQPDRLTLHAGRAPVGGPKWLLSQWIHDRTFTGVMAS
jgi:prolyl 4-hydroxylase